MDDDAEDLVKVLQDVLDGLEGGGVAALRVLECSQGFGVAPRVLELKSEIYQKSRLKRVLLNRNFYGLCSGI